MTKAQKNTVLVLTRLAKAVEDGTVDTTQVSDGLEDFLNDILGMDGFGTEGQFDPRGDGREASWSMSNVQK